MIGENRQLVYDLEANSHEVYFLKKKKRKKGET